MFIIETSECGGEFSARFNDELEMCKVWYGGKEITARVFKYPWLYDRIYNLFNENQDLEHALFCHKHPEECFDEN